MDELVEQGRGTLSFPNRQIVLRRAIEDVGELNDPGSPKQ
jgi:hypothetical protein